MPERLERLAWPSWRPGWLVLLLILACGALAGAVTWLATGSHPAPCRVHAVHHSVVRVCPR